MEQNNYGSNNHLSSNSFNDIYIEGLTARIRKEEFLIFISQSFQTKLTKSLILQVKLPKKIRSFTAKGELKITYVGLMEIK